MPVPPPPQAFPLHVGRLATVCLSVCLSVYVWMSSSQGTEWLDGFYSYSNFKGFISHRSVPGEYVLSSSKLGALQMSSERKMAAIFSKMALMGLIKFH
jgi:hypothetical protein